MTDLDSLKRQQAQLHRQLAAAKAAQPAEPAQALAGVLGDTQAAEQWAAAHEQHRLTLAALDLAVREADRNVVEAEQLAAASIRAERKKEALALVEQRVAKAAEFDQALATVAALYLEYWQLGHALTAYEDVHGFSHSVILWPAKLEWAVAAADRDLARQLDLRSSMARPLAEGERELWQSFRP